MSQFSDLRRSMKSIFLMMTLLGVQNANALTSVGAASTSACAVGAGIPAALVEAEAQAKSAADIACRAYGSTKAMKVDVEILAQYRGSCWSGSDSGVAIKLNYTCD